MRNRTVVVCCLAITHLVLSWTLFLMAFGFDSAEPARTGDVVLQGVTSTLLFPVSILANTSPAGWLPGLLGWLPFLLNSLLWAIALYAAVVMASKRLRRGTVTARALH